eukprot:jgi/Bigna1/79334/fgenesh1_pg.61_\
MHLSMGPCGSSKHASGGGANWTGEGIGKSMLHHRFIPPVSCVTEAHVNRSLQTAGHPPLPPPHCVVPARGTWKRTQGGFTPPGFGPCHARNPIQTSSEAPQKTSGRVRRSRIVQKGVQKSGFSRKKIEGKNFGCRGKGPLCALAQKNMLRGRVKSNSVTSRSSTPKFAKLNVSAPKKCFFLVVLTLVSFRCVAPSGLHGADAAINEAGMIGCDARRAAPELLEIGRTSKTCGRDGAHCASAPQSNEQATASNLTAVSKARRKMGIRVSVHNDTRNSTPVTGAITMIGGGKLYGWDFSIPKGTKFSKADAGIAASCWYTLEFYVSQEGSNKIFKYTKNFQTTAAKGETHLYIKELISSGDGELVENANLDVVDLKVLSEEQIFGFPMSVYGKANRKAIKDKTAYIDSGKDAPFVAAASPEQKGSSGLDFAHNNVMKLKEAKQAQSSLSASAACSSALQFERKAWEAITFLVPLKTSKQAPSREPMHNVTDEGDDTVTEEEYSSGGCFSMAKADQMPPSFKRAPTFHIPDMHEYRLWDTLWPDSTWVKLRNFLILFRFFLLQPLSNNTQEMALYLIVLVLWYPVTYVGYWVMYVGSIVAFFLLIPRLLGWFLTTVLHYTAMNKHPLEFGTIQLMPWIQDMNKLCIHVRVSDVKFGNSVEFKEESNKWFLECRHCDFTVSILFSDLWGLRNFSQCKVWQQRLARLEPLSVCILSYKSQKQGLEHKGKTYCLKVEHCNRILYKTEEIADVTNPHFKEFKLSPQQVNRDQEVPLKIMLYRHKSIIGSELVGYTTVELDEDKTWYDIHDATKKKRKNSKDSKQNMEVLYGDPRAAGKRRASLISPLCQLGISFEASKDAKQMRYCSLVEFKNIDIEARMGGCRKGAAEMGLQYQWLHTRPCYRRVQAFDRTRVGARQMAKYPESSGAQMPKPRRGQRCTKCAASSRLHMQNHSPIIDESFELSPITDPSSVLNVQVVNETLVKKEIIGQWVKTLKWIYLSPYFNHHHSMEVLENHTIRGWFPLVDKTFDSGNFGEIELWIQWTYTEENDPNSPSSRIFKGMVLKEFLKQFFLGSVFPVLKGKTVGSALWQVTVSYIHPRQLYFFHLFTYDLDQSAHGERWYEITRKQFGSGCHPPSENTKVHSCDNDYWRPIILQGLVEINISGKWKLSFAEFKGNTLFFWHTDGKKKKDVVRKIDFSMIVTIEKVKRDAAQVREPLLVLTSTEDCLQTDFGRLSEATEFHDGNDLAYKQRSQTLMKTRNPIYNEFFYLYPVPTASDHVEISFFDHDNLSKDDYIGCVKMPLAHVEVADDVRQTSEKTMVLRDERLGGHASSRGTVTFQICIHENARVREGHVHLNNKTVISPKAAESKNDDAAIDDGAGLDEESGGESQENRRHSNLGTLHERIRAKHRSAKTSLASSVSAPNSPKTFDGLSSGGGGQSVRRGTKSSYTISSVKEEARSPATPKRPSHSRMRSADAVSLSEGRTARRRPFSLAKGMTDMQALIMADSVLRMLDKDKSRRLTMDELKPLEGLEDQQIRDLLLGYLQKGALGKEEKRTMKGISAKKLMTLLGSKLKPLHEFLKLNEEKEQARMRAGDGEIGEDGEVDDDEKELERRTEKKGVHGEAGSAATKHI